MFLNPFTLEIDIIPAIRLIQKTDRGRQGRERISYILKSVQAAQLEAEML